ncbi:MAG: hypothetical protein RMN51_11675 [Verrucomicrobiota bacterium]|nr:hypothetical protein [Limisphaera sp.]MDW8382749.1 hypothetical protein [Verrucomicrobiota bacterium]
MNSRRKGYVQRLLDAAVAVLFCAGLAFFASLIILVYLGYYESFVRRRVLAPLEAIGWFEECAGIVTAFLLLAWVTIGGGMNSQLWKWSPPFWFFRKQPRAVRLAVVILLVLGTLLASFSQFLGLAPN